MSEFLTNAIGLAAAALAAIYLTTRIAPLQFGVHRFDYVLLHVTLACGCVFSAATLLLSARAVSWLDVVVAVASACQLAITHQRGKVWEPPPYMVRGAAHNPPRFR